jgi:rhamnosyltransferase subunit B
VHVILNPLGSHGDVHPFIALGLGLQARGHSITLVSAVPYEELARRHGFDFRPVGTLQDYHGIIENPNLWQPKHNFEVLFGGEPFERMFRQTYFTIAELAQQPDSVVVAGSLSLAARLVQEKLNIPLATVHLQPLALFSVIDPPRTASITIPSWMPIWLRRFLFWFGRSKYLEPLLRPPTNRLRQELNLPPIKDVFGKWRHSTQCILGLFPEWYATAPDWPNVTRLTGFLQFDQTGMKPISPELESFLQGGEPPVVFSFGSAMRTGRVYFEAACQAAELSGFRALLLAKGGEQIPTNLPKNVFHADYAPFSQVFPRASVVVHHGGIGTTAQALSAGVPQLIMPMAFDQPDNAFRLEKLGVARTLLPKDFTGPNIVKKVQELRNTPSYLKQSQTIAERMRQEQPLQATCEIVEGLLTSRGV